MLTQNRFFLLVACATISSGAFGTLLDLSELVVNGGAEADSWSTSGQSIVTGWTISRQNIGAPFTVDVAQYGNSWWEISSPGNAGSQFFSGGSGTVDDWYVILTQDIAMDPADYSSIDGYYARYDLSGLFGGWADQYDAGAVQATFLDSIGGQIGASAVIGNPTSPDRNGVSTLIPYATNGSIPSGTRTARVKVYLHKYAGGAFNDGAADNISLKGGVEISGSVTPEDIAGNVPARALTIDYRDPNTQAVLHTVTTIPQSNGDYSAIAPAQGTFDVAFKMDHWLQKVVASVSTGTTGATNVDVSLANGDVDGDNAVTIFDYSALSTHFDMDSSSPDWATVDPNTGTKPMNSDLDEDGSVSIFDYSILSTNFDMMGD